MKKNRMMRLASLILVLTILSTCAISGTFAKYVTGATSEQETARVAKWGVTVAASSDIFKSTYAADEDTEIVNTVVAEEDVVAPGTAGNLVEMQLGGTPEVAVRITYGAEVTLANWTVNGAFYCPLVFTVGEDTVDGKTFTAAADLETAIEALIAGYSEEYAPGTELGSEEATPSIAWAWAFEGNDVKDTALGNAAAANEDNAATIAITLTTTATQID